MPILGPDGIFVATPLNIRLTVISREADQQQAQILQQMLEQAGIRTNLEVLERITWVNKMQTLDYDVSTYFTSCSRRPSASPFCLTATACLQVSKPL